jgi:hypothetical protein
MRFVLVIAMLFLTACASTTPTKTSGSIYEPKTYRVIGNGRTLDEAKIDGFNSAIEFAVGFVILSDKEAKNDRLVRDDIAKHSAGYIDDFKIIDQMNSSRGVTVVMDVDVKSSKIAERMLNRGKVEGVLEGDKLSGQYNSYLNERKTGDRFIKNVLSSYPRNAFNIEQGKTEFKLDAYRNSIIIIPYQVRWNYEWLTAFSESLSVVQDGDRNSPNAISVASRKPGDWIGSRETYNFNDSVRVKQITSSLDISTHVLIKILDKRGSTIYTGCFPALEHYIQGYNTFSRTRLIAGSETMRNEAHIPVSPGSTLHKNLQSMDKIEMSVINTTANFSACHEKSN